MLTNIPYAGWIYWAMIHFSHTLPHSDNQSYVINQFKYCVKWCKHAASCVQVRVIILRLTGPVIKNTDQLNHWGRVTHICVSRLTIIGSDNGYRNWYQDWGHCGESSQVVGDTTMAEIEVSILFYHDASKHIISMQIRVCISRKWLIKLHQISHYGKQGHRPLSQQLPYVRLGYHCDVTVIPVSLNLDNIPHWKNFTKAIKCLCKI